jgi:hypothetical protein
VKDKKQKYMKTTTTVETQWVQNGAWLTILALLAAQPLLAGPRDDDDDDDRKSQPVILPPIVFQVAGPNAASIQSSVDQFRAALGGVNNGNNMHHLLGHPFTLLSSTHSAWRRGH